MRVAVIGLGSNSLRMLVVNIQDGHLRDRKRYREGLRIFEALDENRCISSAMMERAAAQTAAFCQAAREEGAEDISLFATSAVRDARNQEDFVLAIQHSCGYPVEICSGEEEAALSFWGACTQEDCGLIDIGGGSTEIAVGKGRRIDFSDSLQLGAVRLFRERTIASAQDAYQLSREMEGSIREKLLSFSLPEKWVGVGGTFTAAAALALGAHWEHKEKIHGCPLTLETTEKSIELLSPLSVEERRLLPGVQPQRADIIVHGLAILHSCFQVLGCREITVSEYGNLEGFAKKKYIYP